MLWQTIRCCDSIFLYENHIYQLVLQNHQVLTHHEGSMKLAIHNPLHWVFNKPFLYYLNLKGISVDNLFFVCNMCYQPSVDAIAFLPSNGCVALSVFCSTTTYCGTNDHWICCIICSMQICQTVRSLLVNHLICSVAIQPSWLTTVTRAFVSNVMDTSLILHECVMNLGSVLINMVVMIYDCAEICTWTVSLFSVKEFIRVETH